MVKTKLIVPCKGRKQLYQKYKSRAKKKRLAFELTFDQFDALIQRECAYCGEAPGKRKIYAHGKVYRTLAVGVDRKNSSKGYVKGNVVPCCWTCNFLKGTLSIRKFLHQVRKISKHR